MPTFGEYFQDVYKTSLESLISGNVEREIEFTMYVELEDLDELRAKAIKTERHEQWTLPVDQDNVNGKVRIRLIDDTRPTLCTKIQRPDVVGCEEVELDISPDMFRSLREMAKDGYIKTRYIIPSNIRELYWEVDVFLSNGGSPHPWVKVDLEVKSMSDPIPTFPLKHTRVIYADDELTYTDKERVKRLWEEDWQKMDKVKY